MKLTFTLYNVIAIGVIIGFISLTCVPALAQMTNFKMEAYIENMRKTGQATKMYIEDYNDTWPLAMGHRPAANNYAWGVNVNHPVPSDILDPSSASGMAWVGAEQQAYANSIWINAYRPYSSDYGNFVNPVAQISMLPNDVFVEGRVVPKPGIQMNGLLHGLNDSALVNPEIVPGFWHVQKIILRGRCFSTPALNCGGSPNGPPNCRFNPDGAPSPTYYGSPWNYSQGVMVVYNFTSSVWQFGRRMVVLRADLSTKLVPVGTSMYPELLPREMGMFEPWAMVSGNGIPDAFWAGDADCNDAPYVRSYPCYFRPDRTH